MHKAILTVLICCAALAAGAAHAAPSPDDPALAFTDGDSTLVRESLDQKKIHALYNNGDFDPVIAVLEGFMKRNKTYTHNDSVFIAKHLAVVYTSNPQTVEKGKYYMYRLLELLPSAKLVDMYVSEEVDCIFDKVRDEFMTRQHAMGVDTTRIILPPKAGRQNNPGAAPRQNRGWVNWAWVGGGGALALAGGYLVYLNATSEEKPGPGPVDVKVITPKN